MLAATALRVWIEGFGRLPLPALYAITDTAAMITWYASQRVRNVTIDHMRHVHAGEAQPAALAADARGAVRTAMRYWADMAHSSHVPPDAAIERIEAVDGLDRFFEAYDRGCGVMFVSAHLGNPETLIRVVGNFGLDVLVLTEPLSPPAVHELVHTVRQAPGVRFVPADRAGVRLAIQQLRAGNVLAILADRDVLGTGHPQPFFGERARMPRGAVELALRTGSPIVTGFARRTGGQRMRVSLDAPLYLEPSGDREADVEEGMRRVTQALEAGIRGSPDQWFPLVPVWEGLAT